jgi:hypothetical protein
LTIDIGDRYRADLGRERRDSVLVVSNARFNRLSGRALVAVRVPGPPPGELRPWRVAADGNVFAIDRLRSLPVERLLDHEGRSSHQVVSAIRQAVRHIT